MKGIGTEKLYDVKRKKREIKFNRYTISGAKNPLNQQKLKQVTIS